MAFESGLNQHVVRVYALHPERVHVDSSSASVYATVTEDGLFQFGHSKDHRPDLPQVKVMQAVLDPLGIPLATDSSPASGPMIRSMCPAFVGCRRVWAGVLLYVGDCKMAAREKRAFIQSQGDFSLCPLPALQLAADELALALDVVWSGQQALAPVYRQRDKGEPELIAEGY